MALTKNKIEKLEKALGQKNKGKYKLIFCTVYTNGDYEYGGKIYHSIEELETEHSLMGFDVQIFYWEPEKPPQVGRVKF